MITLGSIVLIPINSSIMKEHMLETMINDLPPMSIFNNGENYIEVDDIYVSQERRYTGLGSLLLDKLIEVAKENGIERSLIYSSSKNMDNIIKFSRKHDYKTWYIQMYK